MIRRPTYVFLCMVLIFFGVGCSSHKTSDSNDITQEITQRPTNQPNMTQVTQAPIQNTAEPNDVEQNTDDLESYSLGDNLRFVILADSRGSDHGVNSKIVKQILSEVKQLSPQPEFAIMPGDLTEGSKEYKVIKAQLEYFKQLVTQYYPIEFFYPGIGNHEMKAGKNGEKAFSETFSEFSAKFLKGYNRTSYYIDVGDTRLFMLNSNHPDEKHKITGKQLDWLKSNIDQSKAHTIFLMHEPAYPTGAEAGYSLDKYPQARDIFWKVVDSLDNSIVFCGHEHNYSRRLVDSSFNEKVGDKKYKFTRSIYQIISGGFGAPLYEQYTSKKNMVVPPIPQYHYTVVDINDSGINIQAINIDGETIDSFQIK